MTKDSLMGRNEERQEKEVSLYHFTEMLFNQDI